MEDRMDDIELRKELAEKLSKEILLVIAENMGTVISIRVACPDGQACVIWFSKSMLRHIFLRSRAITGQYGDVEYKIEAVGK